MTRSEQLRLSPEGADERGATLQSATVGFKGSGPAYTVMTPDSHGICDGPPVIQRGPIKFPRDLRQRLIQTAG